MQEYEYVSLVEVRSLFGCFLTLLDSQELMHSTIGRFVG